MYSSSKINGETVNAIIHYWLSLFITCLVDLKLVSLLMTKYIYEVTLLPLESPYIVVYSIIFFVMD